MHAEAAFTDEPGQAPVPHSVVIFTRVDGALWEANGPCEVARAALLTLVADGIPVVLVSDDHPAEVQRLQRELGLSGPFVCNGGRGLYIPRGYFEELDGLASGDAEWEVFSFPTEDPARGIRLLTSLFSVRCEDLVTIGLGCDWVDRTLLAAVDVPVVVRADGRDQGRLLQHLPHAYLTSASGGRGWSEAVLGSAAV